MRPEDILPIYDRQAGAYAAARRERALVERAWLDRFLTAAPGRRVLDLGCGPGVPLAAYLAAQGAAVTGVDGAGAMLALFRANLPGAEAIGADMRTLALGRRFDAILAWDSVFHLCPADQRAMFPILAAHAAPGAALLLTTGPAAGTRIGRVGAEPVYHASLAPDDYRARLAAHGFAVLCHVAEDPDCGGHTVWLARFTA